MDMRGLLLLVLILSTLDQRKYCKDETWGKKKQSNNFKNSNSIEENTTQEDEIKKDTKYINDYYEDKDNSINLEMCKEKQDNLKDNIDLLEKREIEKTKSNTMGKEGIYMKKDVDKKEQKNIEEEMNDIKEKMETKFSKENVNKMKSKINSVKEKVEVNIDKDKMEKMEEKMKKLEGKFKNSINEEENKTNNIDQEIVDYKSDVEYQNISSLKDNDEKKYVDDYNSEDKNINFISAKNENQDIKDYEFDDEFDDNEEKHLKDYKINSEDLKVDKPKEDIRKNEFDDDSRNTIEVEYKEEKTNVLKNDFKNKEVENESQVEEQVENLKEKLRESMDEKTSEELEKKLKVLKSIMGKNIDIEKIAQAIQQAKGNNKDKFNDIKEVEYIDLGDGEKNQEESNKSSDLKNHVTDDDVKNIYMDKKKL